MIFNDTKTDLPLMFAVHTSKNHMLFVKGKPVMVRRLEVTFQSWGVQVECEGGTAGVRWEDHEAFIEELACMVVVCKVRHNIPDGYLPENPALFTQHAKAMQGGRLCLREGLITRLLTARYGSPDAGWSNCKERVQKHVVNGGVKGLVIDDYTMTEPPEGSAAAAAAAAAADAAIPRIDEAKVLEILFLTPVAKKPPPRGSGSSVLGSSSGVSVAGSSPSPAGSPARSQPPSSPQTPSPQRLQQQQAHQQQPPPQLPRLPLGLQPPPQQKAQAQTLPPKLGSMGSVDLSLSALPADAVTRIPLYLRGNAEHKAANPQAHAASSPFPAAHVRTLP